MTLYVGMTLVVHVHLALSSLLVLASVPDDYHNYYQENTVCGMSPLNKLQNQSYLPVARSAPYILNGQDAYSGQWPFYAWISINGELLCSAVIVSSDMVLTSGRCIMYLGLAQPTHRNKLEGKRQIFIHVGKVDRDEKSKFEVRHEVEAVQMGAYFSYFHWYDKFKDFARVWLRKPIQFNSHVQPICIPSRPEIVNYLAAGRCYAIGGGASHESGYNIIKPKKLQWVELEQYGRELVPLAPTIMNSTITYFGSPVERNRQICGGDEGAPLVALDHNKRWSLIGIGLFSEIKCHRAISSRHKSTFALMDKILGIFDVNFKAPREFAD